MDENEHVAEEPAMVDKEAPTASEAKARNVVSGVNDFRCGACPFRASSRALLVRHEALAHLKKKFFRCGKCSYATHLRARFTKHVKYHSMPMIKCAQCDFRTPYKWNLDRHCRNHGAAGAFRCSRCSFTADIKQSLTVHEMNHHAPASGPAPPNRRRLKVGASDSLQAEERQMLLHASLSLLQPQAEQPPAALAVQKGAPRKDRSVRVKVAALKRFGKHSASHQQQLQPQQRQHNFRSDFIHPDDIIHHKNGNVYIKTLRCRLCNFKAAWEGEMARHEAKVHGIRKETGSSATSPAGAASRPVPSVRPESSPARPSAGRAPRPVPNLIPIQSKMAAGGQGPPILRIPSVRPARLAAASPPEPLAPSLSERDMDEICAKSCATSALKDFAPLIGSDAFVLEDSRSKAPSPLPPSEAETVPGGDYVAMDDEMDAASPSACAGAAGTSTSNCLPSGAAGRKGFLDQLGERLLHSSAALECDACGLRASCLSELARHKRAHETPAGPCAPPPAPAPSELSSTRCQRCRQRCKTSADLLVHLRSCCANHAPASTPASSTSSTTNTNITTPATGLTLESHPASLDRSSLPLSSAILMSPPSIPCSVLSLPNCDATSAVATTIITTSSSGNTTPIISMSASSVSCTTTTSTHDQTTDTASISRSQVSAQSSPHPMENRVFVWNDLSSPSVRDSKISKEVDVTIAEEDDLQTSQETSSESPHSKKASTPSPSQPVVALRASSIGSVKKVFKCPHCSFWASTASRFHVHIVGHLNKKPFECSLCAYRSNWRWDITKHIRLKSARDAGHERARVLMTDETGRRNYVKYNKYLTVLRMRDNNSQQASSQIASSSATNHETESPKQVDSTPQLVVLAPRNITAATLASSLSSRTDIVGIGMNVNTAASPRQLLPAPPRLTPAPIAIATSVSSSLSLAPLRPPPPLAPAVLPGPPRLHPAPKRPQSTPISTEETIFMSHDANIDDIDAVSSTPICTTTTTTTTTTTSVAANVSVPSLKKNNGETKRTLWKCKKCNYKDPRRELVLAHVKQHYQQRAQAVSMSEADASRTVTESEASVAARFKCGHCGQVSHWKHVIQRHCRLKHDGNVQIVTVTKCPVDSMDTLGKESQLDEKNQLEEDENDIADDTNTNNEPLHCSTCPFTSKDSEDLSKHQQNHQPQPGAIFKCYLCPYYVELKVELLDHLQLHGVTEPEDHLSRTLQNNVISSNNPSSPNKVTNDPEIGGNEHGNSVKRYRCAGCPYVSNSKSQFLYHKQFHRPRGAPFKCGLCSYSVSRRHLLHQHLRVHGILIPPQRSPGREPESERKEDGGIEEGEEEAAASGALKAEVPDLDTRALPEVPLVWVSRNGRFDKLFKCRWCPHVNQRKANILEHEKMHRRDEFEDPSECIEFPLGTRQLPPHRCPLCNYGCHNAGVLSAHMKVHQGVFGTIRALVDTTRSDEAQLEELGAANDNLPPLLLPQNSEEIMQGVEDGQEETVDFRIEPPLISEIPPSLEEETQDNNSKILLFCQQCPARFLSLKELNIHTRFHEIRLAHRCESCNYTARQRPHLLAHIKVHSDEYQERTDSLSAIYAISPAYPRPRTAVIVEGPGVSGPVWVVVSVGLSTGPAAPSETGDVEDLQDTPPPPPRPVNKQFSCSQCPAKFFKSVALEYHKTLHSGSGNYGCKYCDYRVKTYGNLVKHEMIHENSNNELAKSPLLSARYRNSGVVPLSGTDLFQQKAEVQKLTGLGNPRLSVDLPVDPQFGTLMHGNPEFVYPMYFKNGRLKEKRYKCHKCPSAFEKREQYKVHLSLHGSKQRYKCEKCDYSVKYYANFIQHQRKHQHNDEAHAARRAAESKSLILADEGDEGSYEEVVKPLVLNSRSIKSIGSGTANRQSLFATEQQAQVHQQVRDRVGFGLRCDDERRMIFRCAHCPYASARRDGLESHAKRHAAVSGICGAFACKHCDYSAPQLHFLREHVKLHFDASRRLRPEAYTRLENLSVWMQVVGRENEAHKLIFQDKGVTGKDFERFYPCLPSEMQIYDECSEESRSYVNIHTGQPLSDLILENRCETIQFMSPMSMRKKTSSCKDKTTEYIEGNLYKSGSEQGVSVSKSNSNFGKNTSSYENGAEKDNVEDFSKDDIDIADRDNDNIHNSASNGKTVVENLSGEESKIFSKVGIMTRKRTLKKLLSHSDNYTKIVKRIKTIPKDEKGCETESEVSEDGEADTENDEPQQSENEERHQKSGIPISGDGESLSASSSCDSSSRKSSSDSSSSSSSPSSSSSSSSGTSSSATNSESKSSDSSSDSGTEESDRVDTNIQSEESISSSTEIV